MLDRGVVKEYLDEKFEELNIETPEDITPDALVETFCRYTENDYYEWLKDNFNSFFNHADPDWRWIKKKTHQHKQD